MIIIDQSYVLQSVSLFLLFSIFAFVLIRCYRARKGLGPIGKPSIPIT